MRPTLSILSVGDGPRIAKHKYTLVDLIGTPEPRVTPADVRVKRQDEVEFHSDYRHRHTPVLVAGPWLGYGHVVLKAATGSNHTLVITGPPTSSAGVAVVGARPPSVYEHDPKQLSSRRLWAGGRNDHGQLGLGHTNNRSGPVQVAFPHIADGHVVSVVDVAGGLHHSVILTGA